MAMVNLELKQFFGLGIDPDRSDIGYLLSLLSSVKAEIRKSSVVQKLIKENDNKHPIISVAKRQQTLKLLKSLLNDKMSAYDKLYYDKKVNTSSDSDRKYGAEEKLLLYALIIASGKSSDTILRDDYQPSLKILRNVAFKGTRFDRYWEILNESTEHTVKMYRSKKPAPDKESGFLAKLFK